MNENKVKKALKKTRLIAWDGCHKIYLAMDETEAEWFRTNYEDTAEGDPETMFGTLQEWWERSCCLRFVTTVSHNEGSSESKYVSIVSQR